MQFKKRFFNFLLFLFFKLQKLQKKFIFIYLFIFFLYLPLVFEFIRVHQCSIVFALGLVWGFSHDQLCKYRRRQLKIKIKLLKRKRWIILQSLALKIKFIRAKLPNYKYHGMMDR